MHDLWNEDASCGILLCLRGLWLNKRMQLIAAALAFVDVKSMVAYRVAEFVATRYGLLTPLPI